MEIEHGDRSSSAVQIRKKGVQGRVMLVVLGFSSGKRMVRFRGGGEPSLGVTAPDRPAVGVPPSGELRFAIALPRGRGSEGPEMFRLAVSVLDARSSRGLVVVSW